MAWFIVLAVALLQRRNVVRGRSHADVGRACASTAARTQPVTLDVEGAGTRGGARAVGRRATDCRCGSIAASIPTPRSRSLATDQPRGRRRSIALAADAGADLGLDDAADGRVLRPRRDAARAGDAVGARPSTRSRRRRRTFARKWLTAAPWEFPRLSEPRLLLRSDARRCGRRAARCGRPIPHDVWAGAVAAGDRADRSRRADAWRGSTSRWTCRADGRVSARRADQAAGAIDARLSAQREPRGGARGACRTRTTLFACGARAGAWKSRAGGKITSACATASRGDARPSGRPSKSRRAARRAAVHAADCQQARGRACSNSWRRSSSSRSRGIRS